MNIWHDLSQSRVTRDCFCTVIEISRGGKNKYELDKETGMLRLDRVLYTSTHYPANYGFIPRTLASDGDPLDVLILCTEAILPMTLVDARPIGVMEMVDEDAHDEKVIAVPLGDPSYAEITDVAQLPAHLAEEMRHFFKVYKMLEGKKTVVRHTRGPERAREIVQECIVRYAQAYE